MKPRIPPLEPPYAPELAEELAAMMPPGAPPLLLFRTLAHNPRVLGKIRSGNLLDRGSLARRDRELVILRTTARCGCAYEWGVHAAFFGARVGLGEAELRATVRGGPEDPAFGEREASLVRLADELHESARLSDPTYAALIRHFSPGQIVELLVLAGFYHAISFAANGLRIAPEPFAPGFPA
jgi:4-carboxymuconolactone decarboxylase